MRNTEFGMLLVLLTGCGTVFNGSSQDINFVTPHGATVTIRDTKGPEVYKGPGQVVSLSRQHDYSVVVTKPGYQETKRALTQHLSGWVFGNIGWIIPVVIAVPCAVDFLSGGAWTLGPDSVSISLVENDPAAALTPVPAYDKIVKKYEMQELQDPPKLPYGTEPPHQ
jgi:hypothetical protein